MIEEFEQIKPRKSMSGDSKNKECFICGRAEHAITKKTGRRGRGMGREGQALRIIQR